MGKPLVRQFKTQVAPAKTRGYRLLGHGANLINPTQAGNVFVGKVDDPGLKEHAEGGTGQLKLNTAVGSGGAGNTLGELLYQQKLAAANQPLPQPQPSTNIPYAADPRDMGYPILQPQPLPYTATLPPTALPPQRPPQRPPIYGQPNVGVDITPEQFTLPPQQQQLIHPRPSVIDYGPITTPIERPTPIDIGNIEPQQSYPITPGPQITATEQSFYEPQPVEGAYAYPIEADYPQIQPQPTDVIQDDITTLIDTLIPEPLEAKTIDFPQEGPQWVEDPQALAAQEAIDQAGFTQVDPSLYSPDINQTIDQAPEIAYIQPQQEDLNVIDYGPTYGDPATQEATQTPYLPPEVIQQLPITQPPAMSGPEIPAPAGGVQAGDDFYWEDRSGGELGRGGGGGHITDITEAIPGGGPIERDLVGAADIAETPEPVRQRKEGPEFLVDPIVDDKEEFKGGLAVTTDVTGDATPDADEGSRGTITAQELVDTQPPQPEFPSHREPTVGGQVTPTTPDPDPVINQGALTSTASGGRRWLHTGPQDFADALHRFRINRGTTQGPPIITDTPAVTGPQVNRETGEITEKPLTWYQFEPTGSSVSPYGATTIGGTTDTTGTTRTGKSGGLLAGGFDSTQIAEIAGGSITPILDYLHPGATSDGQTVTFGDVGNYDDWVDGVLDLDPTLKGIKDLGYQKRDDEGNRVGWGNYALDGFNQITSTINKVFNFMGDPGKVKFTAAILEDFGMMPTKGSSLDEMANNFNKFRKEASQMWETSQDDAWGRKWNDLTQTQEYGDMQPLGIFALLTNPPAALAMTANSLLYDIKNAAQGMFDANPNYKGNMAQKILNGAFHLLGKAAKKVGSLFGKLGKTIGGKLGKVSGDKQEFTDKDMKLDPMEVSRRLLYRSKNEDDEVGDVRYELVKTLLENGVDVRFHNNAISFDKGVAKARIDKIKTVISNLGLSASNIEIMAGTDGLDDFPELKAWLEARAEQLRKEAKS